MNVTVVFHGSQRLHLMRVNDGLAQIYIGGRNADAAQYLTEAEIDQQIAEWVRIKTEYAEQTVTA